MASKVHELYFAFTAPYPCHEISKSMSFFASVCPRDSLLTREVLGYSLDRQPVSLVTISHKKNFLQEEEELVPGAFPRGQQRCRKGTKPVVFISARVHPGETPGSFMLDGFLQALLSADPRALVLRKNFVFKIVPVVNPDGVARGHYRVDQNGINLNRCYSAPSQAEHPTVYAVKEYFQYISRVSSVCFFMDLHAHASRKACFLFGNHFSNERCTENHLFAKIMHLNSAHFEYSDCDFSERNMKLKDPKDHHSKEGSARVAFWNSTGIVCSYTIEAAYYIPRAAHQLPPLVNVKTGKRQLDSSHIHNKPQLAVFNQFMFDEVGGALALSLLDFYQISPVSRIGASQYRTFQNMNESVQAFAKKDALKRTNSRDGSRAQPELRRKQPVSQFLYKMSTVSPSSSALPLAAFNSKALGTFQQKRARAGFPRILIK